MSITELTKYQRWLKQSGISNQFAIENRATLKDTYVFYLESVNDDLENRCKDYMQSLSKIRISQISKINKICNN